MASERSTMSMLGHMTMWHIKHTFLLSTDLVYVMAIVAQQQWDRASDWSIENSSAIHMLRHVSFQQHFLIMKRSCLCDVKINQYVLIFNGWQLKIGGLHKLQANDIIVLGHWLQTRFYNGQRWCLATLINSKELLSTNRNCLQLLATLGNSPNS